MPYILPKLTDTDYTYDGQIYRLRYEGIDESNLILAYYCKNGADYIYTSLPITLLPYAINIGTLSGNCIQITFIKIIQADANSMTFEFVLPEPYWTIEDYNFDLNGVPICGIVPVSATNSLFGYQIRLVVQNAPVTLEITVDIDHIAPGGAVTQYHLTKTQYYEIQDNIEYIYSTNNYQFGIYNLINIQILRID